MITGRMRLLDLVFMMAALVGTCSADLLLPSFIVPDPPAPVLAPRGQATQLTVDGKPFLVLGGELHNSSSSSLDYMKPIWPKLKQMNLNTVLAAVSWDLMEPQEGRFDFTLVDGLIQEARRHDLRLVLLWFGSWKNGMSHYVPDWVKRDTQRFPRVRIASGRHIEVLSPVSGECLGADARAYVAFMQHLRRIDSKQRTVLMIQMENEVGILGDSRDRCDAANQAFAGPVPHELLSYLARHKAELPPDLNEPWSASGFKESGTWNEVFGADARADEIFMAWTYARYMNCVTEMGKVEYALPTYVNAWLAPKDNRKPGDYPSGGPQAHNLEIWRAGAPQIDLVAPDIYASNFADICGQYTRAGNPLFVPESVSGARGAANAFYAIGQMKAIGYSPFAIDAEADPANCPISQAYEILGQLAPLILEAQSKGTIAAVSLSEGSPAQRIALGDYALEVSLRRPRGTDGTPPSGYGLFISTGPDIYVAAGKGIEVTFFTNPAGPQIVGLASVYEGRYVNGRWTPGRKLNGDNVVLSNRLDQMAAEGRSGTGLRFEGGPPSIRQVALYRY